MAVHKTSTGKATASLHPDLQTSVDYSKIKFFGDQSVMFVWVDELESEYTHSSGLIIARTLSTTKDRWGKVVMVGPKSDVKVGEYILPEKTLESFGCVMGGLEHWRTSDDNIFLVSSDYESTHTINE